MVRCITAGRKAAMREILQVKRMSVSADIREKFARNSKIGAENPRMPRGTNQKLVEGE